MRDNRKYGLCEIKSRNHRIILLIMMKFRKSKMTKLMAMVMTGVMMFSVCMEEAFAEVRSSYPSSISTTFCGQPLYAETYYRGNGIIRFGRGK